MIRDLELSWIRVLSLASLVALAASGACGGGDATTGATGSSSSAGGASASSGGQGGSTSSSTGASVGGAGGAGGMACGDGGSDPGPTGATIEVNPGDSLASALGKAKAGDLIRVHAGMYPSEDLSCSFASSVFIEAAPGDKPVFDGLRFTKSDHVTLKGLTFTNKLDLAGSSFFLLDGVTIDLGTADESALEIQDKGQGSPSHDIQVRSSSLHGGARTVFIHVLFSPDVNWNHDLLFLNDDFACGSHNCFQFSGGRDTVIADSLFHDPKGGGVLTAGATRIRVERNRFLGDKAVNSSAVQIATPGKEWDNYGGVENMISSEITVANNLIVGWGGNGIELDGCHDVNLVFNTLADLGGDGLHTWRRSPTDQQGNVILVGNEKISLTSSILPSIALDSGDPRPALESNNLVAKGGGGAALLTGDPGFLDTTTYALAAGSPAIDSGLVDPNNPPDDLVQAPRDAKPDRGALEFGAKVPCKQ